MTEEEFYNQVNAATTAREHAEEELAAIQAEEAEEERLQAWAPILEAARKILPQGFLNFVTLSPKPNESPWPSGSDVIVLNKAGIPLMKIIMAFDTEDRPGWQPTNRTWPFFVYCPDSYGNGIQANTAEEAVSAVAKVWLIEQRRLAAIAEREEQDAIAEKEWQKKHDEQQADLARRHEEEVAEEEAEKRRKEAYNAQIMDLLAEAFTANESAITEWKARSNALLVIASEISELRKLQQIHLVQWRAIQRGTRHD